MLRKYALDLHPTFYILLSAMILILPLKWLLAAIIAAAIHELFHIAAIRACKGKVSSIAFYGNMGNISVSALSYTSELICALAGPVGGLCLLSVARWFPRIAVCAVLQSLYNLLPVYPLDGGRALRCGIKLFMQEDLADKIAKWVEIVCLSAICFLSIYAAFILKLGFGAIFPIVLIFIHTKCRKIPCKQLR